MITIVWTVIRNSQHWVFGMRTKKCTNRNL